MAIYMKVPTIANLQPKTANFHKIAFILFRALRNIAWLGYYFKYPAYGYNIFVYFIWLSLDLNSWMDYYMRCMVTQVHVITIICYLIFEPEVNVCNVYCLAAICIMVIIRWHVLFGTNNNYPALKCKTNVIY